MIKRKIILIVLSSIAAACVLTATIALPFTSLFADEEHQEVLEFKVTFDLDGGTGTASTQTIQSGGYATKPTDPSKNGYRFLGWFLGNAQTAFDFENTPIDGNIVLKARWEVIPVETFTISYDLNGKDGTAPTQVEGVTALPSELPVVADIAGFHFAGWYTDSNCESEAVAGASITENITLYAKWVATFTVTFDLNGGAGTAPTQTIVTGEVATKPTDPTKGEDTFLGWFLDGEDEAFSFDTPITESITLKAKWQAATPTPIKLDKPVVTLTGNVASWSADSHATKFVYVINDGIETDAPASREVTLTDGQTIKVKAIGDGTNYTDSDWSVVVTYTASAQTTYTVSYDLNGKTALKPNTVTNVTALPTTLPVVSDIKGFHFAGWYTDSNCETEAVAGASITEDITLYAKWVNVYTVSFNLDGGTATILDQEIIAGQTATKPEDPIKGEDIFLGWFLGDYTKNVFDFNTPINENIVLNARYRAHTYYDDLLARPEDIVIHDNFDSYTADDKLPVGPAQWNSSNWGTKGIYSSISKRSGDQYELPTLQEAYIELGNGAAKQVDSTDNGGIQLVVDFGTLTSGIVEGYFETEFLEFGNSWTFFQVYGTTTENTSISEVFGIRVDNNTLKYRINASNTLNTPLCSISASKTTYRIYYKINLLDGGKITVKIENTASGNDFEDFVTDLAIGFNSVVGIKLVSSDNKKKNVQSIDYLIVNNLSISLDDYIVRMQNKLDEVYDSYDVDNMSIAIKDQMSAALADGKDSIATGKDYAEVDTKYNLAVESLASIALSSQKALLKDELDNYKNKSLYTENLVALEHEISLGKEAIDNAISYSAAVNALAAAKVKLDAIKTDAQIFNDYKNTAINDVEQYKNKEDYTENIDALNNAIALAAEAINNCTTKEEVDEEYSKAINAIDQIESDADILAKLKETLKSQLASKGEEYTDDLSEKKPAEYQDNIAKINAAVSLGQSNIDDSLNKVLANRAYELALNNLKEIYDMASLDLNDFKTSSKEILQEYATASLIGYDDPDLISEVNSARLAGETAIDNATTKDGVQTGLNDAKEAIDEVIENFTVSGGQCIIKQGDVIIDDYSGKTEAAFIIFNKLAEASTYNIQIKGGKYDSFTTLEDNKVAFLREEDGKMRVDLLGLAAGRYQIKVVPVISGTPNDSKATIVKVVVEAYDRSGYAHFKYSDGVGAYKDDGTLKDNAIVLYVTDENKNTIELSYNGTTVHGIGNILNSVGQACGDPGHENQCKVTPGGTVKYGKANSNQGIIKKLAMANVPLVVRFVGCVSNSGLKKPATFSAASTGLIEGLTVYDSIDCGGTVGDNGHMARMKSGKDITLEGIDESSVIDGWGFHFMCESAAANLGKSFEVRNLKFINTPEDAVGMEGVQESGKIKASVERCWIHNNEFYGPHISSPAESDKGEGDGSCDFKRGQYFTCSYNYFEGCHKTNLVGSADSSLQFNLTYHHNYWKLCKARGPLARQANIHMYNNVFEGQTDYALNPRANAYIFSEYNLFYMCKNPMTIKSGAIKSYNDSFSSCINDMDGTIVNDKSTYVPNSCKYAGENIDYSRFDTDSNQSYIPTGNYELQTSVTDVRKVFVSKGGISKDHAKAVENVAMSDISYLTTANVETVTEVNSYPSDLTPGKLSKKAYAFKITRSAIITIKYASDNYSSTGVLVNEAGECIMTGSGTVELKTPGIYMVQATNFQPGDAGSVTVGSFKDFTINSIHFEEFNSEEFNQQLIADYNEKAANLPTNVVYNDICYQPIKAAMNAYELLSDDLKDSVSVPYSNVLTAWNAYLDLGIAEVVAKINAIGVVNEDSGELISIARIAYNKLTSASNSVVVSNYQKLIEAEEAFTSYAIDSCISKIGAIGIVTLDKETAILLARAEYDNLDEDQRIMITNYDVLLTAEKTLESLKNVQVVVDLMDAIPDVSLASLDSLKAVLDAYDLLSEDDAKLLDTTQEAKYSSIKVQYVVSLIDSIGEVTSEDQATIQLIDQLYEVLSADEKTLIVNYQTLLDAKETLKTLILHETLSWSQASNPISTNNKTGSIAGFDYKIEAVVTLNGEAGIKLKDRDSSQHFTANSLNAIKATLKIKGAISDSSSATTAVVICTYADSTTETFNVDIAGSNGPIVEHSITIEKNGSRITSISITQTANGGKNLFLASVVVEYDY